MPPITEIRRLLIADHERTADLISSLSGNIASMVDGITAGNYGYCERCGQPVSRDRLLARPTARTCINCAAVADPVMASLETS